MCQQRLQSESGREREKTAKDTEIPRQAHERLTSDQGRYPRPLGRLHFAQTKVEGGSSAETIDPTDPIALSPMDNCNVETEDTYSLCIPFITAVLISYSITVLNVLYLHYRFDDLFGDISRRFIKTIYQDDLLRLFIV